MAKHKAQSINDVVEDYRARHVMEPIEAAVFAQINAGITFKGWEEPACQFRHNATQCTHSVTHRVRDCDTPTNLCQAGRASVDQAMAAGDVYCRKCKKPAAECWKVWAV